MVKKENAVEALQTLCKRYGVSRVASKLGYTYAYIHQVATGQLDMYAPLKRRVAKAAQEEWGDFYKHKPTVTVRWSGSEADRQLVLALSNEERERVLLEAAKGKQDE